MNIIYRVNQANSADSLSNAKRVSRTLNLDSEKDGIRIVPQGEEDTDGLFIPSTNSDDFGKVFCGLDGDGKRIYKELHELVEGINGVKVNRVVDSEGSKVVIESDLEGVGGVSVTNTNGKTQIGFSDTNSDGIRGFSYTRFGGNSYNIENSELSGDENPDWIKQIDSSTISIHETDTLSKQYQFVCNKDGIWNVNFSFNDTWNSIVPISGLGNYDAGDFGRPFDVKVEIIKHDGSITGASQEYYMLYTTSISKYQEFVLGQNSTFKVSRKTNTTASSIYAWRTYCDENYKRIAVDEVPVLLNFSIGESEKEFTYMNADAIDAKYIVWSFSKLEIATKTIAPSGELGTITLCHQTVRSMVGNVNIDGTFDKSLWLMLQYGDTVRATCTFSTGPTVPICDVSFGALYMLPGITIGSGVSGQVIYDAVVTDYNEFIVALQNQNVKTVYVTKPIQLAKSTAVGNKIIYGSDITIISNLIFSSSTTTEFVNVYNNVILKGISPINLVFDNIRLRNIVNVESGIKTISSSSDYNCYYERIDNTDYISGGIQSYWDCPISTAVEPQIVYDALVETSIELITALKTNSVETIYVKNDIILSDNTLTDLTTKKIYGETVTIGTGTNSITCDGTTNWIYFYNNVILSGFNYNFSNVKFGIITTSNSDTVTITKDSSYDCYCELNKNPIIVGIYQKFWKTAMIDYVDTVNEQTISGEKIFATGVKANHYDEYVEKFDSFQSTYVIDPLVPMPSFIVIPTDTNDQITFSLASGGDINFAKRFTVAVVPATSATSATDVSCAIDLMIRGSAVRKYITYCDCASFYCYNGNMYWVN